MKDMENIKCINCGAVLVNNKCEYCGSDFSNNHDISGVIDTGNYRGVITIGGVTMNVMLTDMEVSSDTAECMTLGDGFRHRMVTGIHRRITLVEC